MFRLRLSSFRFAETAREAVRDLVLELSMDQAVDQTLAAAPCDACGKPRYVAALHCPSCKVRQPVKFFMRPETTRLYLQPRMFRILSIPGNFRA